jgi:hypothetical protein
MVHALKEAHRVLRPEGLLVDVRPAPVHSRVSVVLSSRYQYVATTREELEDDYAADRAIAAVLRTGIFKLASASRFDCRQVFDSVQEIREWLTEPARHEWLLRKLERTRATHRPGAKIVIRGPIMVQALVKVDQVD